MKVRDVMTSPAIRVGREEPVAVAARTLERYNIGALPVCGADGELCGLVTDRDLVLRCMAAGKDPQKLTVGEVMTGQVTTVTPEMSAKDAARVMGDHRIRRLPVLEQGKLCGMVSLGDLANAWEHTGAEEALGKITEPFR